MIDLSTERVVSLTDATHHLPRRRKGKRPSVATIYRWSLRGCRGVRLETVQVGGTRCTSLEALQRFCERLSSAHPSDSEEAAVSRSRRREREKATAERECAEASL